MKIVIVSLTLVIFGCASSGPKMDLPDHSTKKLKNGLEILHVHDKTLPYVSLGLLIKVGASSDPLAKSGLAQLTAELIERGTKNKSAEQISDAFGRLGTGLSIRTDYDFTYVSVAGLSRTRDELLQLFVEVITEPAFAAPEVERLKREFVAGIKRNYDQPRWVAGRTFAQFLYGQHPYGREVGGSVRDIQSIKQKDIIRHYLKSFRPNQSLLVVVGDVDKNQLAEIERKFSSWTSREQEKEESINMTEVPGSQIRLVHRADLQQSEVRLGHIGIKRKNDDYLALTVADTILSGGFNSRLMREIRVKRGLTYGISAGFSPRLDRGPFLISSNTRHEKVGELITETKNTLEEFYNNGVTEVEVNDAKGYLRGLFPRRLETPEQLANMMATLKFYDISDDYLEDYIKNLNKISAKEVNRVIKQYYRPADLKILVYGPQGKVLSQLRPIGAVEVKNYREVF